MVGAPEKDNDAAALTVCKWGGRGQACQFDPSIAGPFYTSEGRTYCAFHAPLEDVCLVEGQSSKANFSYEESLNFTQRVLNIICSFTERNPAYQVPRHTSSSTL